MRIQHGLIGFMAIVLVAVTTVGSVVSGQYPQASRAEAAGFDALAHGLFGPAAPANEADNK